MPDEPKVVNVISSKFKNVIVTSLKFIDDYLLAGQSGDLHFFKLCNKELFQYKHVHSLEVFPFQNIYGIIPKPINFNFIIFGGKKVSVLRGSKFTEINVVCKWTAEDWLLDGMWLDNDVLLLTAHNVLLHYSYSPFSLLTKACCIEQCILYSGKLLGSKWDDLVVLAGTVYQEVVIWSPKKQDENGVSPVLHHLKGHQGVIFSITYDNEDQLIASTSDDRTVRVWSVSFPKLENSSSKWADSSINLLHTVFGHTARVWRSCFVSLGQLVTVGEDSKICLWDKNGILLNRWEQSGEIRCLDFYDGYIAAGGNGISIRSTSQLPDISSLNINKSFGTPRWVYLNKYGIPVVSTDEGYLICGKDQMFHSVQREKFKTYCVGSISICRNYIIIGGINGELVLYKVATNDFLEVVEENLGETMILSVVWADGRSVVASKKNGHLSLLFVEDVEGCFNLRRVKELVLPPSKERWVTCALLLDDYLICGDRMGSLHLYSRRSGLTAPLDSLLKLHGTKGVSDVKIINNIIYSTGRDGSLKELSINDNKLQLISTLKLPMDWATCIIETKTYGLIIAGFHDTNFLLWTAEERLSLLSLECGGGHRSFDYMFDEGKGNIILSFIRMKDVKYLNYPLQKLMHQKILASYHTKTINCGCILSENDEKTIILTGSEDNSLKICKLDKTSWNGSSTYVRHISAVRTTKCIEDIVVSAGARAQLIVWELTKNSTGELRLKEITSHMIRDENEMRRSWKDAEPLDDPETRYMDVEIIKQDENCFMIVAAGSDGMLRIFEYDSVPKILILKNSVESDQGCLLRISVYNWCNNVGIITGGTKGTVAFWHFPFKSAPSQKHQIHSLGINAMDYILAKNHLVLGTGGDDSSVVLSAFLLDKNKKESFVFNIVEHVHTCQVSGLRITPEYVVSAALDQKLCLFRWSFDGNYLRTTFLCHFVTSVPDIHGILTWSTNKKDLDIFVYGHGFQLVYFEGSAIPM